MALGLVNLAMYRGGLISSWPTIPTPDPKSESILICTIGNGNLLGWYFSIVNLLHHVFHSATPGPNSYS